MWKKAACRSCVKIFEDIKGRCESITPGGCKAVFILLLMVFTIPSFWRMLRPGIFSMHDFHVFRLFEFHKCILDLQIPCRWAPDAAFGWGQPLFNFYNQLVYWLGEPFLLLGFQVIDTIKILFILSLILSSVTMFFLACDFWKSRIAGFVAGILYVYAPYRAVDVWVRGALPEAFAFVFYPLIILFFNRYVVSENKKNLFLFSLSLAGLLLIHNLSFLMFLFFLVSWGVFYFTTQRKWYLVKHFLLSGILIFGLSAFYLLPVIFERNLVTLGETTGGYYDFRIHFASLNQLFLSRFWGYGASLWEENDGMSFSVGHVQWILSILTMSYIFLKRIWGKHKEIVFLFFISWFALFLTHAKSLFLWNLLPGLGFVQFPWRFLAISTFSLALASGSVFVLFKDLRRLVFLSLMVVVIAFGMTVGFFGEDIWYNTTDSKEFSGARWLFHTSSAVRDFWPKAAGGFPSSLAPSGPMLLSGEANSIDFFKSSNAVSLEVDAKGNSASFELPVVYFAGWKGFVDGTDLDIVAGKSGGISFNVREGAHKLAFKFADTPVRNIGNFITLATILTILVLFIYKNRSKQVGFSTNSLFFSILLIALVLRVAYFGKSPPSLNWDEVSHGYNAYSILETGRDEWGEKFPLIFRAYGDYKLPVYIYLTSISEKLFGINQFAVRFPSLVASLVTVVFTFFLVKKLFNREVALVAALLVAVEPWTFFLSRSALEANVSIAFVVAGVYFFVKGLDRPGYLTLSSLMFGLSVWTYNSDRVFVPILLVLLGLVYRRELVILVREKFVFLSLIFILGFFLLPMFWQLANNAGQARYGRVSIIDEGAIASINQARAGSGSPFTARLLDNKVTYFFPRFLGNWVSHFSPRFLFLEGGTQFNYSLPGNGLIYIINSVVLIAGVVLLIKRKDKVSFLLVGWLVFAPIPSSLTREAPHALRAVTMLPVPMIVSAFGLLEILKKIGKDIRRICLVGYLSLVMVFALFYFLKYFTSYRTDYSWSWQYGYEGAVDFVKSNYDNYDKIIFTKKYGEPHEFILFFWPWDPSKFQEDKNLVRFYKDNWYWVDRFDKFYFVNDWEIPEMEDGSWKLESGGEMSIEGSVLLVTSPGNYPEGWNKLKTIYFLNGEIAFEILDKVKN